MCYLMHEREEIITLYEKKGILLPFKNHENNIVPDNCVPRASLHCQTDNRNV